jgi:hypothetical protein
MLATRCGGAGMFWLWLWIVLTGCIIFAHHISIARGDKRPARALWEAIVANLIFGALLTTYRRSLDFIF